MQHFGQEGADVRRYEQELRAGNFLISVFVPDAEEKTEVVKVMKAHGGKQMNFYGPLSIEML